MANLATKIGKIPLAGFIFNAAGPKDKTYEELKIIAESESAAIMIKSCTLEARDGNPEPRYSFVPPYGSISTSGLPNLGYKEYLEIASKIKNEFPNKPLIVSVAGLKLEEFPILVGAFQNSQVDMIEINVHSCPKEKGKLQLAHDVGTLDAMLKSVATLGDKPIGLKLPPYFDANEIEELSALFNKLPLSFITCVSSVPNALSINAESETALIKPKEGIGGLGGSYIKPLALANVRTFYRFLKKDISVIGVGGITTGTDAFEFLLAGASAVQMGTTFYQEGPKCFGRVTEELNTILDKKHYGDISSAKGNLKTL